jgi:hypothetical protein
LLPFKESEVTPLSEYDMRSSFASARMVQWEISYWI